MNKVYRFTRLRVYAFRVQGDERSNFPFEFGGKNTTFSGWFGKKLFIYK